MSETRGSGAAIIAAMKARYREMRSYRDQGVVRTCLYREHPPTETCFETAFTAPNLFRFEFTCRHPFPPLRHLITRFIAGCDGTQSYLYIRHAEERAELRMGNDVSQVVAGATGVSDGAAHTIARLLLPQVGGFAIEPLRDLSIAEDIVIDGVPCHQVVGLHPRGKRLVIVIEKGSLLLRSLSVGHGEVGGHKEERWAIGVDEALDLGTFAIPRTDL